MDKLHFYELICGSRFGLQHEQQRDKTHKHDIFNEDQIMKTTSTRVRFKAQVVYVIGTSLIHFTG